MTLTAGIYYCDRTQRLADDHGSVVAGLPGITGKLFWVS